MHFLASLVPWHTATWLLVSPFPLSVWAIERKDFM